MDRVQNEISKLNHEQRMEGQIREAQLRQIKKEHDGLHKWIDLTPRLSLLCRIDDKGKLLPKEVERIKNIKKKLGIRKTT